MNRKYSSHLRPLIALAIVSLILAGLFFPFLMTGVGQALFPYQANGDQVQLNGRTIGSYYIDNNFTLPVFFHGRYENANAPQNSSASLYDPDITLAQAYSQVARISSATGISGGALTNLINSNVEGTFWIFGSPYVNVLNLNLILIRDYPSVYSNYA